MSESTSSNGGSGGWLGFWIFLSVYTYIEATGIGDLDESVVGEIDGNALLTTGGWVLGAIILVVALIFSGAAIVGAFNAWRKT